MRIRAAFGFQGQLAKSKLIGFVVQSSSGTKIHHYESGGCIA